MTLNAADRKSIRAAEKAARLDARARGEIITSVMSTTAGRAWLWDLLATCHIFTTTFAPEPTLAAFAEGERNIGLRLLADILAHCPDQYITAMRESDERQHLYDNRTDAAQRHSGPLDDGRDLGREGSTDAEADGEWDDLDPGDHA